MHWLSHVITFHQLGEIYHIGTSTTHAALHEVVTVLEVRIVKTSIPGGGLELDIVIDEFRQGRWPLSVCWCTGGNICAHAKAKCLGDPCWCYKII